MNFKKIIPYLFTGFTFLVTLSGDINKKSLSNLDSILNNNKNISNNLFKANYKVPFFGNTLEEQIEILTKINKQDTISSKIKPVYERDISSIVMTHRSENKISKISMTKANIINALPNYSNIFLLNNSNNQLSNIILSYIDVNKRDNIYFLEDSLLYDFWSQNLYEGDGINNVVGLKIISNKYRAGVISLTEYGANFKIAPFEVNGGNIHLVKNNKNERTIIMGADSYYNTKDFYEENNLFIDEEEFKLLVNDFFATKNTILVGSRGDDGQLRKQSRYFYDLDLFVLPLGDGLIAMPNVDKLIETYPDLHYLYEGLIQVKDSKKLLENDFKIIDLEISKDNIIFYQSYSNSIVYFNKETNEKNIIMPIFPNVYLKKDYEYSIGSKYKMKGNNLKNKNILEQFGKVICVEDHSFIFEGNLNCQINNGPILYKNQ